MLSRLSVRSLPIITAACLSPFLFSRNGVTIEDIKKIYADKYHSDIVKYKDEIGENGFICSNKLSFNDSMEIFVEGNEDRILLMSRYDNLGKGASGAAIQNMNILLGTDEKTGLEV